MPESAYQIVAALAALAVLILGVNFSVRSNRKDDERRVSDMEAARQREDLERKLATLADAHASLSGKLEQFASATQTNQSLLQKTLEERLDGVRTVMNERLGDQAEKTAESLGKLNERLTVIDEAQKNITELSGQVVSLQDILANKQARGAFGEIQLNDIVKSALPPAAYAFQETLSNGRRADCIVKLPNPPGPIAIDSKFPLEDFNAMRNAETKDEATRAASDFRRAVLKHIVDIAERYVSAEETADSALMFVPSEAVYAELHANFSDVVQKSYQARVWIVSPTTLMATLNTVRAVLKDVQMREQAHLIQAEVVKMMGDVHRLRDRVDNLQKHFGQTVKDVKEIATSTDKIVRQAERIDDLKLDDPEAQKLLHPPAKPAQAPFDA